MQDAFVVQNGANRDWTMTEELDLGTLGEETPGVTTFIDENFAVVRSETDRGVFCHLWAIGDNLYVAHLAGRKGASNSVYWSNSLRDAFDFAAEAINLS